MPKRGYLIAGFCRSQSSSPKDRRRRKGWRFSAPRPKVRVSWLRLQCVRLTHAAICPVAFCQDRVEAGEKQSRQDEKDNKGPQQRFIGFPPVKDRARNHRADNSSPCVKQSHVAANLGIM